jgi:hypothetical protein
MHGQSIKEKCMVSSTKGEVQMVNKKWHMTSLLGETCGHSVKKRTLIKVGTLDQHMRMYGQSINKEHEVNPSWWGHTISLKGIHD